jgi:hypothetical protein
VPEIDHHDLGDLWTVRATFRVDEVETNPGAVSAVLRPPSGTLVTIPNGDPRIDNPSVGVFDISDVGAEVGVHYLEVTGTSPAAGKERFSFVVDPRWPSDLLGPKALTTIEACELMMDRVGVQGPTGREADDQRWIASLINTFSTLAMNYAAREWMPTTDDLERTFTYDGDGILSLSPYELRDVTSVTLYSDLPVDVRPPYSDLVEGYTLVGYSWYGEPSTMTESGTWLELKLPERRRWCQVAVVGDWGAGVVPDDVAHVVEAEVANSYWASRVRAPLGPQEPSYLPQQPQFGGSVALDPRSMEILDAYRNVGLL